MAKETYPNFSSLEDEPQVNNNQPVNPDKGINAVKIGDIPNYVTPESAGDKDSYKPYDPMDYIVNPFSTKMTEVDTNTGEVKYKDGPLEIAKKKQEEYDKYGDWREWDVQASPAQFEADKAEGMIPLNQTYQEYKDNAKKQIELDNALGIAAETQTFGEIINNFADDFVNSTNASEVLKYSVSRVWDYSQETCRRIKNEIKNDISGEGAVKVMDELDPNHQFLPFEVYKGGLNILEYNDIKPYILAPSVLYNNLYQVLNNEITKTPGYNDLVKNLITSGYFGEFDEDGNFVPNEKFDYFTERMIGPLMEKGGSELQDLLVKLEAPRSTFEYVAKKAFGDSLIGNLFGATSRVVDWAFSKTHGTESNYTDLYKEYRNANQIIDQAVSEGKVAGVGDWGKVNIFGNEITGRDLAALGGSFILDTPFFGYMGKVSGSAIAKITERRMATEIANLGREKAWQLMLHEAEAAKVLGTSAWPAIVHGFERAAISQAIVMGSYEGTQETLSSLASGDELNIGEIAKAYAVGGAKGAALGITGELTGKLSQAFNMGGRMETLAKFTTEDLTFATMSYAEQWEQWNAMDKTGMTPEEIEASKPNFVNSIVDSTVNLAVMKAASGVTQAEEFGNRVKSFIKGTGNVRALSLSRDNIREARNSESVTNLFSSIEALSKTKAEGNELVDAKQAVIKAYRDVMRDKNVSTEMKYKLCFAMGGTLPENIYGTQSASYEQQEDGTYVVTGRDREGNTTFISYCKKEADAIKMRDDALDESILRYGSADDLNTAIAILAEKSKNSAFGFAKMSVEEIRDAVNSYMTGKATKKQEAVAKLICETLEKQNLTGMESNVPYGLEVGKSVSLPQAFEEGDNPVSDDDRVRIDKVVEEQNYMGKDGQMHHFDGAVTVSWREKVTNPDGTTSVTRKSKVLNLRWYREKYTMNQIEMGVKTDHDAVAAGNTIVAKDAQLNYDSARAYLTTNGVADSQLYGESIRLVNDPDADPTMKAMAKKFLESYYVYWQGLRERIGKTGDKAVEEASKKLEGKLYTDKEGNQERLIEAVAPWGERVVILSGRLDGIVETYNPETGVTRKADGKSLKEVSDQKVPDILDESRRIAENTEARVISSEMYPDFKEGDSIYIDNDGKTAKVTKVENVYAMNGAVVAKEVTYVDENGKEHKMDMNEAKALDMKVEYLLHRDRIVANSSKESTEKSAEEEQKVKFSQDGNIDTTATSAADAYDYYENQRDGKATQMADGKIAELTDRIAKLESPLAKGDMSDTEYSEALDQMHDEAEKAKKELQYWQEIKNERTRRGAQALVDEKQRNAEKIANKENGIVDNTSVELAGIAPELYAFADRVGKTLGLTIEVQDRDPENNGKNDNQGHITIFLDAEDIRFKGKDNMKRTMNSILTAVLGHELDHTFFKADPELAGQFIEATKKELGEERYKKAFEQKKKLYEKQIKGMSEAEATRYINEEIASDYAGTILADEKNAQYLDSLLKRTLDADNVTWDVKASRFERFKGFIDGIIKNLNSDPVETLETEQPGTIGEEQKKQLQEDIDAISDQLGKASDIFAKMFESAKKNSHKTVSMNDTKESMKAVEDIVKGEGNVTIVDKDGNMVMEKTDKGISLSRKAYMGEDPNVPNTRDLVIRYATVHGGFDIVEQMDKLVKLSDDMLSDPEGYSTYAKWENTAVILDANGNPAFSIVKKNGEYPLNIDASTNCKKREETNAVLNDLIKEGLIGKDGLSEEDIIALKQIITKHGLEVACDIFFVDERRYHAGSQGKTVANDHNHVIETYLLKGTPYTLDDLDHFNFAGDETIAKKNFDVEKLNWKALEKVAKKAKSNTRMGFIINGLLGNHSFAKVADWTDFIATEGKIGERQAGAEGEYMNSVFNRIGTSIMKRSEPQADNLHQILTDHSKGSGTSFTYIPKTIARDADGNMVWVDAKGGKEMFGDTDKARMDIYRIAGVRLQSFSDAQAWYWFDDAETICDLALKQLPAHKYTKELWNAKAYGKTGVKHNLSAVARIKKGVYATDNRFGKKGDPIAPGLDENGNLIWADYYVYDGDEIVGSIQSINVADAIELHHTPGYSADCGVIAVGASDEQIILIQESDDYSMVIGFHSNLSGDVKHKTGLEGSSNYVKCQHERSFLNDEEKQKWLNGEINSTDDVVGKNFSDSNPKPKALKNFNFYDTLDKYYKKAQNGEVDMKDVPDLAAKEYLDMCWDNGFLPEFDQFAWLREDDWHGIKNFRGKLVMGEDGRPMMRKNYFKHVTDYCLIDGVTGEYAPQRAVTFNLPTEADKFGSFESIIKDAVKYFDDIELKRDSAHEAIKQEYREQVFMKNERLKEIANEGYAALKRGEKLSEEQVAAISKVEDVSIDDVKKMQTNALGKVNYSKKSDDGSTVNLREDGDIDIFAPDGEKYSIKGWHGSAADFDHFDYSFMGSGEGSQVFGWGGYISGVHGIARGYAGTAVINAKNKLGGPYLTKNGQRMHNFSKDLGWALGLKSVDIDDIVLSAFANARYMNKPVLDFVNDRLSVYKKNVENGNFYPEETRKVVRDLYIPRLEKVLESINNNDWQWVDPTKPSIIKDGKRLDAHKEDYDDFDGRTMTTDQLLGGMLVLYNGDWDKVKSLLETGIKQRESQLDGKYGNVFKEIAEDTIDNYREALEIVNNGHKGWDVTPASVVKHHLYEVEIPDDEGPKSDAQIVEEVLDKNGNGFNIGKYVEWHGGYREDFFSIDRNIDGDGIETMCDWYNALHPDAPIAGEAHKPTNEREMKALKAIKKEINESGLSWSDAVNIVSDNADRYPQTYGFTSDDCFDFTNDPLEADWKKVKDAVYDLSNEVIAQRDTESEKEPNYLSWDEVMGYDEKENIKTRIVNAMTAKGWEEHMIANFEGKMDRNCDTGGDVYETLSRMRGMDAKKASQLLHDAGFVGNKVSTGYAHRGQTRDTKNYVIFNEDDAKIVNYENHEKWSKKADTHSENFKNWFGDWEKDPEKASKVVDKNGEPLVVYHGTPDAGFYEFDNSKGAMWATSSRKHADVYAEDDKSSDAGYVNNVYPLYMDIKRPLDLGLIDAPLYQSVRYFDVCDKLGVDPFELAKECNPLYWESLIADAERGGAKGDDAEETAMSFYQYFMVTKSKKFADICKEKGYDGLRAKEVVTDGSYDIVNTYAVFEPTQIKSATDNNGNYDPTNPDIRYSQKTLAGVHNISEDKLRKALNLGGLANPSAAVVDTTKNLWTDYGRISLIMPSSLVDKRTGRNAGTWDRDMWSPMYPEVEYFSNATSDKNVEELISGIDKGFARELKQGILGYVRGNNYGEALKYLFLKEKGMAPEIAMHKGLSDKQMPAQEYRAFFGKEEPEYEDYLALDAEQKKKFNALRLCGGNEEAAEALLKKDFGNDKFGRMYQRILNEEISRSSFEMSYNGAKRIEREAGTPDYDKTLKEADYIVAQNNLSQEFDNWAAKKIGELGYDEKFQVGFNERTGDRIYKKNTLANVSAYMKKQGRVNSDDHFGISGGSIIASLAKRMDSLSEIRDAKDRLDTPEREEWDNLVNDIQSASKIFRNGSSFDFSSEQDALGYIEDIVAGKSIDWVEKDYNKWHKNTPIKLTLEQRNTLRDIQERAKNVKVPFFEIKFERPVGIEEFVSAVVPKDTSSDIIDALKEKGLEVVTYDPSIDGDRERVQLKAMQSRDDVLFSKKVTPEEDADYLKAVESGDTETVQKMVDDAFKRAFPNSKVLDKDGKPIRVYHNTDTDFNEFDKSKIEVGNGFWFSEEPITNHYGNITKAYYLNLENPVVVDTRDEWKPIPDADSRGIMYIGRTEPKWGVVGKDRNGRNKWGVVQDGRDFVQYIAGEPNQIKSADPITYDDNGNVIPLSERFNPANNDIRFSKKIGNSDPFYSNAAKVVEGIKQNKATGIQWLAMLKKNGGLKAEEDKWMGLSDWLSSKPSVTKEEVEQFIAENAIKVEEVKYQDLTDELRKGLDKIRDEFEEIKKQVANEKLEQSPEVAQQKWDEFSYQMYDKYGANYSTMLNQEEEAINRELRHNLRKAKNGFKAMNNAHVVAFGRMVDKYGQDFEKGFQLINGQLYFEKSYRSGTANNSALRIIGVESRPINSTRESYQTEGLRNNKEIALTVPTIEPYEKNDDVHFGDAGEGRAVAWLRFGDSTDTNGNKVLVIDEVQSKRHQDGREKGYRDDDIARKREELSKQYGQLNSHYYDVASRIEAASNYVVREKLIDKNIDAIRGNITAEQYQELKSIISQLDAIAAERESLPSQENAVPDAPFRKNWQELAMKRMLRYAAEHGYDKIAWTTGQQQTDRYPSLKAVVKSIDWVPYGDGKFVTINFQSERKPMRILTDKDGNIKEFLNGNNEMNTSSMSSLVGKEIAEKIMSAEGSGSLKDAGLDLGGKGMKAFYDKMLPDFMNKYGKKWGVKVQDVTLDLPNEADQVMHSVDVTPEMKESVMEGQPMFSKKAKESLEESFAEKAKQDYGSGNTSINGNKLPSGFGLVEKVGGFKEGTVNLDMGGGKFDNATEMLAGKGVENLVFDPYNRDAQYNAMVAERMRTEGADTVTCNNCLNVINTKGARSNVILQCAKALKPDGTAYFTVYENNGTGKGEPSKNDCWQENRKTADYIDEIEEHFGDVVRKGKLIIAREPLTDGKVSVWNYDESGENNTQFSKKSHDLDIISYAKESLANGGKKRKEELKTLVTDTPLEDFGVSLREIPAKGFESKRTGTHTFGLDEYEKYLKDEIEAEENISQGNVLPTGSDKRLKELQQRLSILESEKVRRTDKWNELVGKYNIGNNGEISIDDAERLYKDLGGDDALSELFGLTRKALDGRNIPMRITDIAPNRKGAFEYTTYFADDRINYNKDLFLRDDPLAYKTILHEMIHAGVEHLLDDYVGGLGGILGKGVLGDIERGMGIRRRRLSQGQKELASELLNIYDQLKDREGFDSKGNRFYGLDSANEMVAELANPEFRAWLEQQHLLGDGKKSALTRIKDWIKRNLLGYADANVSGNALKEIETRVSKQLNNIYNAEKPVSVSDNIFDYAKDAMSKHQADIDAQISYSKKMSKGKPTRKQGEPEDKYTARVRMWEDSFNREIKEGDEENPMPVIDSENPFNASPEEYADITARLQEIDARKAAQEKARMPFTEQPGGGGDDGGDDDITREALGMLGDKGIDMSDTGLRRHVHDSVLRRRAQIDVSNYDDNLVLKKIHDTLNKKERAQMVSILEGTYAGTVTEKQKEMAELIRDWFDSVHTNLLENGFFEPGRTDSYLENYVTHIWDFDKSDKDAVRWFKETLRKNTPYVKHRVLDTYAQGIEMGLVPKFTDIVDIMAQYGRYANEAIANRQFIQNLEGLSIDGQPVLIGKDVIDPDYVELPNTAISDYKVLKSVADLLNPIFGRKTTAPEESALHTLGTTWDTISGIRKKIALSLSAFHYIALTEGAVGNINALRTAKVIAKNMVWDYAIKGLMGKGTKPAFQDPALTKDALAHGVKLGATEDYSKPVVDNFLGTIAKWTSEHDVKIGSYSWLARGVNAISKGLDVALWDIAHDAYKLYSYKYIANDIRKRCEKRGKSFEETERLLNTLGQWINDSFGGQNWENIGFSPLQTRWMRRLLMSPDWTVSSMVRQPLALIGIGNGYNTNKFGLPTSKAKLLEDFKWMKDAYASPEGRQRMKLATKFWVSGLLQMGVAYMALNAFFRWKDEQEQKAIAEEKRKTDPDYKSPYELAYPDGMKWYDYTMIGNTIGNKTHLFTGRYSDGSERYTREGKQFREIPELFYGHDGFDFPGAAIDKMKGKTNPTINDLLTLSGGAMNSKFPNREMKDAEPGWERTSAMGSILVNMLYPYSMSGNTEFTPLDLFMPSTKGMRPYHAKQLMISAMQSRNAEAMKSVYQACAMNGLNVDDIFKAAQSELKMKYKKHMMDGVDDLDDAIKQFGSETNLDRKAKLEKFISEEMSDSIYHMPNMTDFQQKAIDWMSDANALKGQEDNMYLKYSTSEDLMQELRIKGILQRLEPVHDELKASGFDEQFYNDNQLECDMYNLITEYNQGISKKKKEMKGATSDKERQGYMDDIRNSRKELFEQLDEMGK